MWNSSDSKTPTSAPTSDAQPPASFAPSTPQNQPSQGQYTMIGKSIRIKGEIVASDPVYIYGSVEGSISAPAHRVTVGKEGTVKAGITAREVVIMGDVCGNLKSEERIEIRNEGSLMGDLATTRLCIEEGAVLQGSIDVHKPTEKAKPPVSAKSLPALNSAETKSASPSFALSEAG